MHRVAVVDRGLDSEQVLLLDRRLPRVEGQQLLVAVELAPAAPRQFLTMVAMMGDG